MKPCLSPFEGHFEGQRDALGVFPTEQVVSPPPSHSEVPRHLGLGLEREDPYSLILVSTVGVLKVVSFNI